MYCNTTMPQRFLPILFCFMAFALNGQDSLSDLRLWQWQQHLPWFQCNYATQDQTRAWLSTDWSLVEVDKSDLSPRFLTKVEGLSDVGIRLAKYNAATQTVFIAYNNSNIDLYDPNAETTENLPFIKKNINLIGDKKIYDLLFEGEDAYLSTGFGMVKMSVRTGETDYTIFTPVAVNATALLQGYVYIGTENGLYRLPQNDQTPADFNRWEAIGAAQGLPEATSISAMTAFDGQLWIGYGQSLYRFDGSTPAVLQVTHPEREVRFFSTEGVGLVIGWRKGFDGSVEYVEKNSTNRVEVHWGCEAGKPSHAIEEGSRKFWFADFDAPMRRLDFNTGVCDRFTFNSPLWHQAPEISIARGKVYVASPGASSNLSPTFNSRGIYVFEDGIWRYMTGSTNPELTSGSCHLDSWRIIGHPQAEKFYVGSFIGGLVEASDDLKTVKCYTKDNSILQDAGSAGSGRTAISGMAFDEDQNLWICNYNAVAPVAVLKNDGTLQNFSEAPNRVPLQVAVDQNGYKWFVLGFNAGVMVFDSGKDIDSPADDRWRTISTANSNLPSNTVGCVSVDLDGDVWIGTLQGVVTFECGSNVFDEDCKGRRRIVNVDGFNGYLLETEDVRTIAVDGANRKWFGTTNGIFVQSADGLEQVARFTNTNSPLFDNIITDIAINDKNGEVWIATEKGIQSLRGDATVGTKINSTSPYAFPNPVTADYDGPIAIYGLARDANVKITDVAGNLVYEGKALGGQAVWNGRDYTGKRAASGVYLVFATSVATFDEPDAIITKVVMLR
jgi:hypothetical protein